MKTLPLVIQLADGINNDTSDVDSRKPGISYTENTDFTHKGEIQGRPSFVSHNLLGSRVLNNGSPDVDPGTLEVASVPFSFSSLFRYRDSLGERPGLAANGRVWTWEDNRFTDRTYCGSARFERLAEFSVATGTGATTPDDPAAAIAYNFMPMTTVNPNNKAALLGATKPSIEGFVPGSGGEVLGGACSVVDGNGDSWHCAVGQSNLGPNANIILVTRKNHDMALTTTTLKTDCSIAASPGTATNRTVCCSDENSQSTFGAPCIWVAYPNGANSINVMRVNAATGAVLAQSSYTLAAITALSIAVNSTTNTLVMGLTRTAITGAACRLFNATTCVNNVAGDNQFNGGSTATNQAVVVIGIADQATPTALIAYQENGGLQNCTIVGKYVPGTPTSFILKSLGTDDFLSAWIPAHNPVLISGPNNSSNKRIILGVYYDRAVQAIGTNPLFIQTTYIALDFTDVVKEGVAETKTWGTLNPGILAIGTPDADAHTSINPKSAIVASTLDSYRFGGYQFKAFSSAGGSNLAIGINQVTLIYPKAATIGEETVLSGSVPRAIARGYAFERMFVQGSPEILVTVTGGGAVAVGSHTLQACWMWIDESGVTHRSAPSQAPITASTTGGNQTYTVKATNLIVHNRSNFRVFLEIYMTAVNPTTTSPKLLVASNQQASGATSTFVITAEPAASALALYTNNGAVLQNTVVSADGGVATVNRRMFMSDGRVVFASKLLDQISNIAVAWNDEGPLIITLPTPAGRILSLEALDDKLLIFCEHGIFMTQGDGPDNSGIGQSFLSPVMISEMGIQCERATVSTVHGVVFYTDNGTANKLPGYGGLFMIDRGLTVHSIGTQVQDILGGQAGVSGTTQVHLSYVVERDLLMVNKFASGSGATYLPRGGFFLMLDMKNGDTPGEWSVWTAPNGDINTNKAPGTPLSLVGAGGVLWGLFGPSSDLNNKWALGSFDGLPGTDAAVDGADSAHPYRMTTKTNHVYANNNDAGGWARVRAVTPTGSTHGTYTQSITVTQDQNNILPTSSTTVTIPAAAGGQLWPIPREAVEYRLPNQKCSQIQIQLSGMPAIATWSTIRLDVIPFKTKAPTASRR